MPLWSSVSGDGLSGTWQSPGDADDRIVIALNADQYDLVAFDGGLSAGGNGVQSLAFAGWYEGLTSGGLGPTTNLIDFFSGKAGTYVAIDGSEGQISTAGDMATFTIDSLTITVQSVPELSTSSLLVLAGLTVLTGRRRWRTLSSGY
jgi:hypothetical protein